MLIEHFQLGVQPFGVTPDTRFLYLSQTHREALASLLYGIRSGRGFTALIAPPGMGKTTLLFQVLKLLRGNAKTAFLFQTLCGTEEFLRSLLDDLGIEHEGDDVTRMHAKLNAFLVEESKKGHEVIVVIDEAQNLDDRVLELVRMLSNFETSGKKLMHLILSGQPQLAETLASDRFIQLRQRISIIARLSPFNADETREYIEHRLHVAGASKDLPVFSDHACALIAEHSGGIPRNINNLCFNSMSLACALKEPRVEVSMVRETINDLDLATVTPREAEIQIRPRTWSTIFSQTASPAHPWRYGAVLMIGLLCALAVVFELGSPGSSRFLANHSVNVKSPAAHSEKSTSMIGMGENGRGSAAAVDVRRLLEYSHRSQELSKKPQAGEKATNSEKSSVPFELAPQREKP